MSFCGRETGVERGQHGASLGLEKDQRRRQVDYAYQPVATAHIGDRRVFILQLQPA